MSPDRIELLAFNGRHLIKCRMKVKEMNRMKEDYLTVNELAKEFRVNPKTIYRRLWAKGIPAYKVGQQWRIAKKDLVWLKR